MRFFSVIVSLNLIFIGDFQASQVYARLRKSTSVKQESCCCGDIDNSSVINDSREQQESASERGRSDSPLGFLDQKPAIIKLQAVQRGRQARKAIIKEVQKNSDQPEKKIVINFKTVREAGEQKDSPDNWQLWSELKDTRNVAEFEGSRDLQEMSEALRKNNFAALPKYYSKFLYDALTDAVAGKGGWTSAWCHPLMNAVFPSIGEKSIAEGYDGKKYCFFLVTHQQRGKNGDGHVPVFHTDAPSVDHANRMLYGRVVPETIDMGQRRKLGFENNRSNSFYFMNAMHPNVPRGVHLLAEMLWEKTQFFEQAFLGSKSVKLWLPDSKIPSEKDSSKQYPPKHLALATRPNCTPFEKSAFQNQSPDFRNNGITIFPSELSNRVEYHLSGDDGVIFFADEVLHCGMVLQKERNSETGKFEIKKPGVSKKICPNPAANLQHYTPPMELFDLAAERFGIFGEDEKMNVSQSESTNLENSDEVKKSEEPLAELSHDLHIQAIVWENLEVAFDNLFLNGDLADFEDGTGLEYKPIFCTEFENQPTNIPLYDILDQKFVTRKFKESPEEVTVKQQLAKLSGDDARAFANWFDVRAAVADRFKTNFAAFLEKAIHADDNDSTKGSFAQAESGKQHGG